MTIRTEQFEQQGTGQVILLTSVAVNPREKLTEAQITSIGLEFKQQIERQLRVLKQ